MNDLSEQLNEAENCYQKKEYQVAFDKYLELAQEGHVQSQVFVGWMYASGIGTPIDKKKHPSGLNVPPCLVQWKVNFTMEGI